MKKVPTVKSAIAPSSFLRYRRSLLGAILTAAVLVASSQLVSESASAATEPTGDTAATCAVEFHPTVSTDGFTHPGVSLTAGELENARDQVAAGAEPWTSYYTSMTQSAAANSTTSSSNASSADPTKPDSLAFSSQSFNGRFVADGLKAYTQTLMFVFTGSTVYRDNALRIIRIWEQMDPAQFAYFSDAHIHTGIPLNRMVTAAEILRYSSCVGEETPWTDTDTSLFSDNLISPVIETFQHDNNRFMNQHTYPLLGAMAGYIFTDNAPRYSEAVEWFTVNATAHDQGFNGSISQLFRLVTHDDATGQPIAAPRVQHVEMGRDQAHGGGDITNAYYLARMMLVQGTTVDPVTGVTSTAPDAVGPYEFLDDRILSAADYFWQYMLGYDTPWTPVAYAISPDGTIRDTYNQISSNYRGRYNTASFWDLYYYYTYERGLDLATVAPHFTEAFSKRSPLTYFYGGAATNAWNGVDGGGDFWLHIPADAIDTSVPKPQVGATTLEIEDRYTDLAGDVESHVDGDVGYVSLAANATASRIAYLSGSTASKTIGFRVRSDGPATLRLSSGFSKTTTIPDTASNWRNVVVTLSDGESIGDFLTLEVTGGGAQVDFDSIDTDVAAHSTAPLFPASLPSRLVGYTGASMITNFTATDPGSGETLTYSASDLPPGATLDAASGALTWAPQAELSADVVIAADDGTTIVAQRVVLDASTSRADALQAAQRDFDSSATYETGTEATYAGALEAATPLLQGGSDADFLTALQSVTDAATRLRLVSPRIADGSLDYPALLAGSTADVDVYKLADNSNQTGVPFSRAVDRAHTFDFGADHRVSASSFGLQSNIFPDRVAGSAVFGSNDNTNWTRLTPDLTVMTQAFQTLTVAPELVDEQFRYIKVRLVEPQPDVLHGSKGNLLEPTEFHIFGDRHEVGNAVAEATISSPNAIAGKISSGDQVTASVTTKTAVTAVSVTVNGVGIAATSSDGVQWAATTTVSAVASGPVTLAVDYTDAEGAAGPTLTGSTDGKTLFVGGDGSKLINVADTATVTASDKQWPGNGLSAAEVGYLLFDGQADTAGDLNSGAGSFYVIDFGAGATIALEQVFLLPRTGKATRTNGTLVQASADATTWTDVTAAVSGAKDGTWIDAGPLLATSPSARYLRVINQAAWSGNLAEVQVYGTVTFDDGYFETQVLDASTSTRASADEYSHRVAELRAQWAAPGVDRSEVLRQLAAAESILVNAAILSNPINISRSQVVASSASYDNRANASDNGWRAFDGDPATAVDTKAANGWVTVDFGAGQSRAVATIRFLPRANNVARMNGGSFQGSDDGTTWDTLSTVGGVTEARWYEVHVASDRAYRYFRFVTSSGFANVAELDFRERVVDTTLLTVLVSRGDAAADPDAWTEASLGTLDVALAAGRSLLDDPTSQSAVDASTQAISDAITGLVPLEAAWTPAQVHNAGDRVAHDGATFVALWWTQTQVPGASPWSAWAEIGAQTRCAAGDARAWARSSQHAEGDVVVHGGHRWRASWWSRNQAPGETGGPWKDLGAC
jgi:chitodextrinase